MLDNARPVEVHLFAAAKAAAGGDGMLTVDSGTLDQVLTSAVSLRPGLAAILERCATLVDGVAVHDHEVVVAPGARVDVLPPFAGG